MSIEIRPHMGLFLNRKLRDALADFLSFRNLAMFVVLVTSYFVFGKLGLTLVFLNPNATALWAPTGISLAAFLMLGYRAWLAVFVGAFLVGVTNGSLLASLGIAVGNTLEGFVGAYLVNRFANGTKAFSKPQDVLRFAVLAGMLATTISATVGVAVLYRFGLASWTAVQPIWLTWWLGDALGALALTPFLVLLLGNSHHSLSLGELLEVTALLAGLSIMCVISFGPPALSWSKAYGPLFLCLPFVVWVVLRFCPLEAAGAALVLSGFASWGSFHGYGPFADNTGAPLLLAGYVAIVGTMTLTVATAVAQRRQFEEELLAVQSLLRATIEKITRDLNEAVDLLHAEAAEHRETQRALQASNRWLLQLMLHGAGALHATAKSQSRSQQRLYGVQNDYW
jgi:integral membrane sensor domain MASE1